MFSIVYSAQNNFNFIGFYEFPMNTIKNGNLVGTIDGTIFGGAELVAGKKGLALYTNGVDQYVDFGYQGDTCLGYFIFCTQGWVTAFWMQPRNNSIFGVIMDTGVGSNRGHGLSWYLGELKAYFVTDNKFWFLSSMFNYEPGWIHVVVTWSQCHGVKLYINGGLATMHIGTISSTVADDNIPRLLKLGTNTKDNTDMFKGTLDELRIWDTIMSDGDVQALYITDAGSS